MSKKNEQPNKPSGQPTQDNVTKMAPQKCTSEGCKSKPARFEFCNEHFEQFKFGLITKKGQKVPDYEKKLEHYHAYVARQSGARKVA